MSLSMNYVVSFIIEAVKILLICCGVLGFKLIFKLQNFLLTGLCIIIIILTAGKEYQEYMPFFYGNLAAFVCMLWCRGKNKVFFCIMIYVFVSLFDMIIVSYIFCFGLSSSETLRKDYLLNIGVNSISIALITVTTIVKRIVFKEYSKKFEYLKRQYILLFISAGFIIALYFTPVINYNFSKETNSILSLFLCMGGIIFIMIFLSLVNSNFKTELYKNTIKRQNDNIEAKKLYEETRLAMSDKRRRLFHDIMFHVKSMYALLNNNEYEELNEYFNSIIQRYDDTLLEYDTGNHVLNAIIQDCKHRYIEINFTVSGLLPDKINLSFTDTCTIFSNLIENACSAANGSLHEKYVTVEIKIINSSLYAVIENTFNPNALFSNGLGSINVQECVINNYGKVEYSRDNERFKVEVILPNAVNFTE